MKLYKIELDIPEMLPITVVSHNIRAALNVAEGWYNKKYPNSYIFIVACKSISEVTYISIVEGLE